MDLRWSDDDRARRRSKQHFSFCRELHQTAGYLDISRHQREWFFLAIFSIPQGATGPVIWRVARKVVASQSFQGHDLTCCEEFDGPPNARLASENCSLG